MLLRPLATSHGVHSPERWALHTAQEIFDISNVAPGGDREVEARKAQLAIVDALTAHHDKVQTEERGKLQADPEHSAKPRDVDAYIEDALGAAADALKGTPWPGHFSGEVAEGARRVFKTHFSEVQAIERQQHAKTGNKAAVEFRAAIHGV